MELNHINESAVQTQAAAAGFATAELYIQHLIQKDADRLAVQQGFEDVEAGRLRRFSEFNQEMLQLLDIKPDE